MKVAQSCPTPCDLIDFITVHGILQARILEWVAFPFSMDLPNPGIEPRSPALQVDQLSSKGSPPIEEYVNYFQFFLQLSVIFFFPVKISLIFQILVIYCFIDFNCMVKWFKLIPSAKNNLLLLSVIQQRRQWHPTPVLLPGKLHGWRSLVGCGPWGH